MKDLTPLIVGSPVAHIATWDKVDLHGRMTSVADLLDSNVTNTDMGRAFVDLVVARART